MNQPGTILIIKDARVPVSENTEVGVYVDRTVESSATHMSQKVSIPQGKSSRKGLNYTKVRSKRPSAASKRAVGHDGGVALAQSTGVVEKVQLDLASIMGNDDSGCGSGSEEGTGVHTEKMLVTQPLGLFRAQCEVLARGPAVEFTGLGRTVDYELTFLNKVITQTDEETEHNDGDPTEAQVKVVSVSGSKEVRGNVASTKSTRGQPNNYIFSQILKFLCFPPDEVIATSAEVRSLLSKSTNSPLEDFFNYYRVILEQDVSQLSTA